MKKLISVILALVIIASLVGCSSQNSDPLNVAFLKGPTGVGASYMMSNNSDKYNFTVEADASAVTSALISGDLDIAAVPTNVAATLYNKTGGEIQILAVNTLSVLYILENGGTVADIPDLSGRTIYTTGQGSNPEYVLNYVLESNNIDATVEFLPADELTAKMASGELDLCMLPIPNATTVIMKNSDIHMALSIGEEWENISGCALTQGCVVGRTDKLSKKQIKDFLSDYEESINYMSDSVNIDDAAKLAFDNGIVGSEDIAIMSIPYCGLTYVTGTSELSSMLDEYFQVLFDADPASVGGALPDSGIYYEI